MSGVTEEVEIGIAKRRRRPPGDWEKFKAQFGPLPDGVVPVGPPLSCPACGSNRVMWAITDAQALPGRVHPLVWHKTQRLADTYFCGDCDPGRIEPDEPAQIKWIRPWRTTDRGL